jgi:hypothetical protein
VPQRTQTGPASLKIDVHPTKALRNFASDRSSSKPQSPRQTCRTSAGSSRPPRGLSTGRAHDHAAFEEQLLDVAKARLKPEIPAHAAADDCSQKAMTVIERPTFFCGAGNAYQLKISNSLFGPVVTMNVNAVTRRDSDLFAMCTWRELKRMPLLNLG